jgi:hypothetical protein
MAYGNAQEIAALDEGSWIYLSTGSRATSLDPEFLETLVEACVQSGWRAVTHPPPERGGDAPDSGYVASVSHAVEHADLVVAMLGKRNEITDAELTLACGHGRPVVGVQVGKAPLDGEASVLLDGYERARIVTCDSAQECAVSLQKTLSDPAFVETIRQAW